MCITNTVHVWRAHLCLSFNGLSIQGLFDTELSVAVFHIVSTENEMHCVNGRLKIELAPTRNAHMFTHIILNLVNWSPALGPTPIGCTCTLYVYMRRSIEK